MSLVRPAQAAPPSSPSGDAQVVELRIEVEQLASDLQAERDASRQELAALRVEKKELERRLRLAKARRAALQAAQADAQAKAVERRAELDAWEAPVRKAMAIVRAYVERSLPYAKAARLERLAKLDRELTGGRSDLATVAEGLWNFVQQEAQLAREVSSNQQAFTTRDGTRRFGEVLHFGMSAAYARGADGHMAWAVKRGDAWVFEAIDAASEAGQVVTALFDAHEQHQTFGAKQLLVRMPEAGGAAP